MRDAGAERRGARLRGARRSVDPVRAPGWRWGVLAALVAVLLAMPSLARVLPADAGNRPPAALIERARASAQVAWSGYGQSSGTLALPDVRALAEIPELLGGTTRTRTWWRGPRDTRTDVLTPAGETGLVQDPAGAWLWDSGEREAVRVDGEPPVRLPRAADLVAPMLGRRLARTPGLVPAALPDRRIAGHRAAGLRLTAPPDQPTTVQSVDLWVEPRTGLVLRVEVRARGQAAPSLTSSLLDLSLELPAQRRTAFALPPDADVTSVSAPDLAAGIDRFAPFLLPATLAGQSRRNRVDGLRGTGGVGTYGDGLTALVLLPLPSDVARRAMRRIEPDDDDGRVALSTPLLGLRIVALPDTAYLLAGTVPAAVLDAALAQLAAKPPMRRPEP